MTFHEESDAPRSQDSVTGGAGGPAVSHASSALITEPEFLLDLGKARLLMNSSPQPDGPA
jgi:1,6-anhydro-N-acetylmuramate kinase